MTKGQQRVALAAIWRDPDPVAAMARFTKSAGYAPGWGDYLLRIRGYRPGARHAQ